MTATPVPADTALDDAAARRLTSEIRLVASSVHSGLDRLRILIDRAAAGNVHQVLGFTSWPAYLADVLGSKDLHLDTTERRELVGYLSSTGVSTRGIAQAVGASKNTVTNDLKQVSQVGTPAPDLAETSVASSGIDLTEPRFALTDDEHEQALALARGADDLSEAGVNTAARKVLNDRPTTKPATTGLDGKTYPRQPQSLPRRSDITKAASRAGWDARRLANRIDRIGKDDRLPRNREALARDLVGSLRYAIDVYQTVLQQLEQEQTLDDVVEPAPTSGATVCIEVGRNTALVRAGWNPVWQVLDRLGIKSMRDPASRLMCFPAKHADDVQAALELRRINCILQRPGDA
jgi:hypothetical protein